MRGEIAYVRYINTQRVDNGASYNLLQRIIPKKGKVLNLRITDQPKEIKPILVGLKIGTEGI